VLKGVLTPESVSTCRFVPNETGFRSRMFMGRHGLDAGSTSISLSIAGSYRVAHCTYRELAPVQSMNEAMRIEVRYPREHSTLFSAPRCRTAYPDPTPSSVVLVLQLLHQDLYGNMSFRQVAFLLSDQDGYLLWDRLTEQRPRMQSRPEVVPTPGMPCLCGSSSTVQERENLSRESSAWREPSSSGTEYSRYHLSRR